MLDKSQALVLEALRQAMAEPAGLPLFAGKAQPGLFAGNAAGKQAAQLCQREGYLTCLRSEPRGKAAVDVCAISEKGLAYLLGQVNPTPVLEAILQALETRQQQFADLLGSARDSQRHLQELQRTAAAALEHYRQVQAPARPAIVHNGQARPSDAAHAVAVLDSLAKWQSAGNLGDCPLPSLFHGVRAMAAGLSVGQFHDCLRALHLEKRIYLHPWTGPLYEIPEPGLALMIGHEVIYYASTN